MTAPTAHLILQFTLFHPLSTSDHRLHTQWRAHRSPDKFGDLADVYACPKCVRVLPFGGSAEGPSNGNILDVRLKHYFRGAHFQC
jgi:hypothetical protein